MSDFEFDPEEEVEWIGVGTLTLRTAVARITALSPEDRRLVVLYRKAGKAPAFFGFGHIEQLAALHEFKGAG